MFDIVHVFLVTKHCSYITIGSLFPVEVQCATREQLRSFLPIHSELKLIKAMSDYRNDVSLAQHFTIQ